VPLARQATPAGVRVAAPMRAGSTSVLPRMSRPCAETAGCARRVSRFGVSVTDGTRGWPAASEQRLDAG
jgi:hypothetical protein